MDRLDRVERDVGEIKHSLIHIDATLVEHGQRIDRVEAAIHQLHRGLGERIERLEHGFERLEHGFERLEHGLGSRLDRLIAVTIDERTRSYERLADIERRLTKLEEGSGS